jgi:putative Holliday junction resolvase
MPGTPDRGTTTSLLAFDFGLRRIGVAVGQTITRSARAVTTLAASDGEPDWAALDALIEDWAPDLLLVGLPLREDGSESPATEAARRFAARLNRFGKPVQLIDEVLTSAAAQDLLKAQRASGDRRRRVRKRDVDAMSAVLIAEQWLNERRIG